LRVLILGCAAIGLAAALMAGGHQVVDHDQLIAVEPHYESLMIGPVAEIDAEDARTIYERRKKYPPRQIAETEDQPRAIWDRDLEVVV
jgi:threonine dehydrogenase-like Zn-dependent dehydrogenase